MTYDASPNYFYSPGVAEQLLGAYPDAKFILLLRRPRVARILSLPAD